MKLQKITVSIASVGAAALLLAGCTSGEPDVIVYQEPLHQNAEQSVSQTDPSETGSSEKDATAETDSMNSATGDAGTALNIAVSPEEAGEIALKAHPNTQVASIELERTRGTTAWEVQLLSDQGEWEVSVDVLTGQIVKDEQEKSHCSDDDCQWISQAKLNYKQAIQHMHEAVPGGQIVELGFDDEDGRAVWEADILTDHSQKHEVTIDAETGKVLEHSGHHNDKHH